ncbi:hypothetical protein CLOHYLEM_04525 [[Clostridium] hylemonae DSM 15053]|uniref:Uncharacterized protein n=2 Tax=[Clostridium] hylemonae TaxID=89153 RepID=C0BXI8_9FIRM|nr:hypothetical protein CLOHYLEM_04525 [[Clostridium] hylemonae DSM 15053]QEK17012.1 hypothetical protein LAJLEIBI_01021 [[Clostridium] hylemonae DSM 15053]
MPDKKELLGKLDPAAMERVSRYYRDGAFEFGLDTEGHTVREGNTVYHILPRFAEPGAESVVSKLRRIMERELKENE